MGLSRDNLPDFQFDRPWKWLFLPGLVLQWLLFMFPTGGRSSLAIGARHARSPLMTYIYGLGFYAVVVFVGVSLLLKQH